MFYKAVMNGQASGQDIKNILYYRTGVGVDLSVFGLGGAESVANAIKDQVWPAWKNVVTNEYILETVDVSPINDAFEMVYQMPYSLQVGQAGTNANASYGPAGCMNFKFNLEPTSIINGIKPPSRGYVAVGPIPAEYVGEDGFVTVARMAHPDTVALQNALKGNLEVLLPAPIVFFPVRLKQSRLLGGLIRWESYSDINGCTVSRRASFRRSRMPEA